MGPETFRAKSESHVSQSPVPSLLKVLGRHVRLSVGGRWSRSASRSSTAWLGGQPVLPARPADRVCRVVLCPMSLGGWKRLLAQPL